MLQSRSTFVAGLVLVLGLGAAVPVPAFSIFDHKAITIEALRDYTYPMASGEIKFADLEPIYDANQRQDWKKDEPGQPPAQRQKERHCDNANLAGCKLRVDVMRAEIVTALLDPPDGVFARNELGKALHTIQDFYAHSTWVETRSESPRDFLRDSSCPPQIACPSLNAGPTDEQPCTGTGDQISDGKLTSGWYFHGFGALSQARLKIAAPEYACLHGQLVPPDDGVGPLIELPGIAKDHPSHPKHAAARDLAVLATVQFVNEIRDALPLESRDLGMCALMGAARCQGRILRAVVTIQDHAPDGSWYGALPGTAENLDLGSPVTPPSSWFGNSGSTCLGGAEGGFHFRVDSDATLYPARISLNFPTQLLGGYSQRRPCSSFVAVKNLGTPFQEVWLVGATRFENPASGSTREWQIHYYSGHPTDPGRRPFMELGVSSSGYYEKLRDILVYRVDVVREVLP